MGFLFLLIKLGSFGQATLYRMGQRVLEENGGVRDVSYVLPNKHYVPVDMRYIGIDNLTPYVVHFCLCLRFLGGERNVTFHRVTRPGIVFPHIPPTLHLAPIWTGR